MQCSTCARLIPVAGLLAWSFASAALAQQEQEQSEHRRIVSISVCSPNFAGPSGSCPTGSRDTAQPVLGPDGNAVNSWGGMSTLSDEHQTIFPPGTIASHHDYLFFVATRTAANPTASGLVVLSGGKGPAPSGQWTLDFAADYGNGGVPGQIFVTAMAHASCPVNVSDPLQQDPTFDLNYAAPASVVIDPTVRGRDGQGSLLTIYEGTNRCLGLPDTASYPSNAGNSFYSTIGIATSRDNGHTWPTYRSNFDPLNPLPMSNPSAGPRAPFGAFGGDVCAGNDCGSLQQADYGRYAVSGPPVGVADAITKLASKGKELADSTGNSEPSAYVDDARGVFEEPQDSRNGTFLYVVYGYHPGPPILGNPPVPQTLTGDQNELAIVRARLNGRAPLQFWKWKDGAFSEAALGTGNVNAPTPIFTVDPLNGFTKCLDPGQNRVMGSISFVDATRQYLLTFVCISPEGDPRGSSDKAGAAWFYSTIDARLFDLSHQEQWSVPREIIGSWSDFAPNGDCGRHFSGWYPSFMSLGQSPGRLGRDGFVFYMDGCTDRETNAGRVFSTRAFTITTD